LSIKEWRISTTLTPEGKEIFSLAPLAGLNFLFTPDPTPDFAEIKELLLQGTKEADTKIRSRGIIISHDAIVLRRKLQEES